MKIAMLTGEGSFTNDKGDLVKYPIRKLVIQNNEGNEVEVKLDKMAYILLSYLFDFKDEGVTEDSNGVQCSLFLLREKNEVDIK